MIINGVYASWSWKYKYHREIGIRNLPSGAKRNQACGLSCKVAQLGKESEKEYY